MRKFLLLVSALFVGSFAVVANEAAAPVAAPAAVVAAPAPVAAAPAASKDMINQLKAKHHKHKGKHGSHHHHGAGGVGAGIEHPVHGNVYNSAHKNKSHCYAHCTHHHGHVKNLDPAFHGELIKECHAECDHHHKTAQVTNPNGPGKGAGAKPRVK